MANPDGSFRLFGVLVKPPQTSIHPRVASGKKKVNTCAPRSQRNGGAGGKVLRKAAKALGIRVKDFEVSKNSAHRRPGSMQP